VLTPAIWFSAIAIFNEVLTNCNWPCLLLQLTMIPRVLLQLGIWPCCLLLSPCCIDGKLADSCPWGTCAVWQSSCHGWVSQRLVCWWCTQKRHALVIIINFVSNLLDLKSALCDVKSHLAVCSWVVNPDLFCHLCCHNAARRHHEALCRVSCWSRLQDLSITNASMYQQISLATPQYSALTCDSLESHVSPDQGCRMILLP